MTDQSAPSPWRRRVLASVAGAGLISHLPAALTQSEWKPHGPIRLVVPWPPGGASDLLARAIGHGVSERLGRPLVVDNKPGATGSIGSGYVYSAPADGTTLFTGMAPALLGLMSKQVDIMLVVVGGAAQHRAKLKFFGVTSSERAAILPDVPTLKEQGLDITGEAWMGVLAPPGTPDAVTVTPARTITEVTAQPEFKQKVTELGMSTLSGSQAQFASYYLDEYRKWGELVRAADIRLE